MSCVMGEVVAEVGWVHTGCNNIIVMSLRRLAGMEGGVVDLQLQIKPRIVAFAEKTTTPWVLYLEKGMQVIGRFPTDEQPARESVYKFRNCANCVFRLNNLTNGNYTWRLYRISPTNGQQIPQETTSFNVKMSVELYDLELTEKEREIQSTLKDKAVHRNTILETWKTLRMQLKNRKTPLKCTFHNKANLEFTIQIKNPLDLEIQKIKEDQILRESMRRKRSLERQGNTDGIDPDHTIKIQIAGEGRQRHYEVQGDETEPVRTSPPAKKFSLLSDIIEQSVQFSSSYGYPQHAATTNKFGVDDPVLGVPEQSRSANLEAQQNNNNLAKLRTLQDKGRPINFLNPAQQFRRAVTTDKHHQDDDTSQQLDSSFETGDIREVTVPSKPGGKKWGRWAWLVVGIIAGLALLGQLDWGEARKKKPKSKKVKVSSR